MTDELGADLCLVGELGFRESLEDWIVVEVNSIPELGPPMVKIVDAIEVKVFFVPPEHGLPRTNIDIGRIYSRYFLIAQPPPKQRNTVSTYVRIESIFDKFHGVFASNNDPRTSAP